MAELKTRPTKVSVADFIATVDAGRQADCKALVKIFSKASGHRAAMWGPAIVGFGTYHYVYASGREGDWMLAGFSPRKRDLTLYIAPCSVRHDELLGRLGKFSQGKACIYIKRLADIDQTVLSEMIAESVAELKRTHETR